MRIIDATTLAEANNQTGTYPVELVRIETTDANTPGGNEMARISIPDNTSTATITENTNDPDTYLANTIYTIKIPTAGYTQPAGTNLTNFQFAYENSSGNVIDWVNFETDAVQIANLQDLRDFWATVEFPFPYDNFRSDDDFLYFDIDVADSTFRPGAIAGASQRFVLQRQSSPNTANWYIDTTEVEIYPALRYSYDPDVSDTFFGLNVEIQTTSFDQDLNSTEILTQAGNEISALDPAITFNGITNLDGANRYIDIDLGTQTNLLQNILSNVTVSSAYNIFQLTQIDGFPPSSDSNLTLTTCYKDINYQNSIYQASSSILELSTIEETIDVKTNSIKITLGAVPNTIIGALENVDAIGGIVTIYQAFYNIETNSVEGQIYQKWKGVINSHSVDENNTEGTVTIEVECKNIVGTILNTKNGRFTSDSSLRDYYKKINPNATTAEINTNYDKSAEFVASLVAWNPNFGQEE